MSTRDLLAKAQQEADAGRAYAEAVVVRAVAPTSAKPGDRAVITERGEIHGWIGGSCAEPTVLREAAAALADGEARLVRITPDAAAEAEREGDGLVVVPMTCYSGGSLEVFVEPFAAKPTLVVCGNSPVAQGLIDLGRPLGFRTVVVDLSDRPELRGADRMVRAAVDVEAVVTEQSFVVVATHGTFDEEALSLVLPRRPAYVGLVTSRRRFESVRGRLAARGLAPALIDRVEAPAGLDLGGGAPPEIALAILARITELRHRPAQPVAAREPPAAPAPPPAAAGGSCCAKKKAASGSNG